MTRILMIAVFLASLMAVAHARHDSIFGFDHSFIPEDKTTSAPDAAEAGDDNGGDGPQGGGDNGENGGGDNGDTGGPQGY